MKSPGKRVLLAGAVALVSVLAGSGGPWPVLQPAYAGTADGAPAMPGRLGIPSQPILPGASVGYLPGSGSVTPQGGYTYTLPLEVPAGRAGMQPSLALSYASGGNGVLGVGWSLSGLSSITRCGQTLSTQGYVGGVHMTDFPADPAAGVPEDSFAWMDKRWWRSTAKPMARTGRSIGPNWTAMRGLFPPAVVGPWHRTRLRCRPRAV